MTKITFFGEERDPTQADLDRWRDEERREMWDEGPDISRKAPKKTSHVFSQCNIVGCKICSGA